MEEGIYSLRDYASKANAYCLCIFNYEAAWGKFTAGTHTNLTSSPELPSALPPCCTLLGRHMDLPGMPQL